MFLKSAKKPHFCSHSLTKKYVYFFKLLNTIMTFSSYRLKNNKVSINLIPAFVCSVFALFIGLDGSILAQQFDMGWRGYAAVASIISPSLVITLVYISYTSRKFKQQLSHKDEIIIPILCYTVTLLLFGVDCVLVTYMPIKYCGIIGQISFCIALLVIGNAVTWHYYLPANILYSVLVFIGSVLENKLTPTNWLPWKADLVYLPLQLTVPTVILVMIATTILNRLSEVDGRRSYMDRERLQYIMEHDPLTEAYNRTSLKIEYFVNKFFFMTDIDFFKKLNDNFSHEMGDKCLKKFADIVRNNIKKEDRLIRYGGEEFIILFSGESTKEEMHKKADDLRKAVEEETSKIKDLADPNFVAPFTISVGVNYADPRFTLEDSIKIADKYLYEAKKKGRNRVISALNSDHPY